MILRINAQDLRVDDEVNNNGNWLPVLRIEPVQDTEHGPVYVVDHPNGQVVEYPHEPDPEARPLCVRRVSSEHDR